MGLAVVLGAASLLGSAAAAAVWVSVPGRVGIPSTAAELGLVLTVVGGLVLWRRPRHRIAVLMTSTGLAFSLGTLATAVLNAAATGTVLCRRLE